MINPLGDSVIEQVIQDMSRWDQLNIEPDFHVALNNSAKQLFGSKLSGTLQQQLQKHDLLPSKIHVEVTETFLMQDKSNAKVILDDIRNLGIEVWLDDFGTGYSSLGYLLEFNIDGIEIDQSFVSDLTSDKNSQALCSAIILMAHKLNIKVVAEGVESLEQSAYLSNENCDLAQGYLYSSVVPPDQFLKLLEANINKTIEFNGSK